MLTKNMNEEKIYGLVGRVLRHSFSVPIHKELGCENYRLIELEPEALKSFFEDKNIMGVNITIPYKRDAMQYCDEIDEAAQKVGSINTVVRRFDKANGVNADCADGYLTGYNTDVFGLQYAVKRAGIDICDKKIIVFGSGGASLAAHAAAELGHARECITISRSGENNYNNIEKHIDADVLINATPVGMYPETGAMPADPKMFYKCSGVVDMIYNPARTAFIHSALKLGIPCTDGLPMLVAQAVRAEELFFDKKIPADKLESIISKVRKDTLNIVLVGMPGSGKSTVGKALAAISGKKFIDLDEEIAAAAGCTIDEIFAQSGESEFRRLEHEAAKRFGKESGLVISCGGGIVKADKNYWHLKQNGYIYHIERNVALLSRDGRPLSKDADLGIMYEQRLPMYMAFRDKAVINDKSPQETALEIWNDYLKADI